LVAIVWYFGTGVEVKPGQTVHCDPEKGCILRLSQVYPFPSLSILGLFVSTVLLNFISRIVS
jgi:hypothetical protein